MSTPYKTYAVTLTGREQVSPSFLRITLSGDDLGDCSPTLLDQRVKLLLGTDQALDLVVGQGDNWYQALISAGEAGPSLRTYTLVAVRRAADAPASPGEVDIDVAIHDLAEDEPAPGMRFAREAPLGSRTVLVAGDRWVAGHDEVGVAWRAGITDEVLLVGDETALPAALNILATLPEQARGRIVLEVPHPGDVRQVATPPGVSLEWRVRSRGESALGVFAPGTGPIDQDADVAGPGETTGTDETLLWDEVEHLARRQAWVAGEAGWVRQLRREAKLAGVARSEVSFMGYWKRGSAGS